MKKTMKKMFPLGLDIPGQMAIIVVLLGILFLFGHITYVYNLKNEILKTCYETVPEYYRLKENYEVPDFLPMLRNCFDIGWYIIGLLCLVAYNYGYHFKTYKCIYLMRRIPDAFEIHRRCWGVLAVGIICAVICIILMLAFFYGQYCTYDFLNLPEWYEPYQW